MTGDATAVQLEDIAQIAVTVPNLEQAKTFYRDVLGMKFLFDAGTMAFFQCGTVRLLLGTGNRTRAEPFSTTACRILKASMLRSNRRARCLCRARI